jgi:predicted nuclease with TOPRIM domain
MDEKTFHSKLDELMQEIATLPKEQQARLTEMAAQARDRQAKLKKTVTDLQESLDYLRLSIKYLVFDLEATRRENGYLRKMVERSQAPGTEGDGFEHHGNV